MIALIIVIMSPTHLVFRAFATGNFQNQNETSTRTPPRTNDEYETKQSEEQLLLVFQKSEIKMTFTFILVSQNTY